MDNDNSEKDLDRSPHENGRLHADLEDGNLHLDISGTGIALLYIIHQCVRELSRNSGIPFRIITTHLNSLYYEAEAAQPDLEIVNNMEVTIWLQ